MSWSKITLFGFYEWMQDHDENLFSGLVLPDGIEKDMFIESLLLEGGEFEVLYSNPTFYKAAITTWGRKHYRTFQKWITALNIDYEPLENYNRHEEWTDTGSSSKTSTDGRKETRTLNLSDVTEEDITDTNDLSGTSETTGSNTNTRSAFDADTYQPHDKTDATSETITTDTGDVTRDRDQTVTHTGTDSLQRSGNISDVGSETGKHEGHLYGNIGVTTSQQMLKEELDISRWNIYSNMIDLFIEELLIPVYS